MKLRESWPAASIGHRLYRAGKIALLSALKCCGFFALARRRNRGRVRILCYHGAWIGGAGFAGDAMFIKPETFERRLRSLHAGRFNVITLDQAVAGLRREQALPTDAVVITIDDGWYGTFVHMFPALKRHGIPAVLYCDTDNLLSGQPVLHVMARYLGNIYRDRVDGAQAHSLLEVAADPRASRDIKADALRKLAETIGVDLKSFFNRRAFSYMTPAELAHADKDGFAIELHTHHHSLHNFDPDEIKQEIEANRAALAAVLDRPPQSFTHFCYPSGVTSPHVGKILEKLGVRSATTLESALAGPDRDPMFLPRLIDGDHLTGLEFEAALCGVSELLGKLRDRFRERLHARRLALATSGAQSSVF